MPMLADLPELQPGGANLLITDDQVATAKDNKAVAFVAMHPVEFARLTTTDKRHMDELLSADPDRKGERKSLEAYNRWAREESIRVPPFLRVRMKSGRVVGHEGRHRAAALFHEDPGAFLWVAIELLDAAGSVYYVEDWSRGWQHVTRRYLDSGDIPRVLKGEFRRTEVDLDEMPGRPVVEIER